MNSGVPKLFFGKAKAELSHSKLLRKFPRYSTITDHLGSWKINFISACAKTGLIVQRRL